MRSFRLGSQAARAEARRPTAPVDSGVALAIRVTPARIGRRAPRLALLSGTMFAGVALVTALASPTLADGGKGGDASSFANSGGAGGVTSATGGGATANGGNAVPSRGGGGGGGGAGVTGGAGGFGTQSGGIGTVSGGNGATTAGGSGVAGTNAVDVGCSPVRWWRRRWRRARRDDHHLDNQFEPAERRQWRCGRQCQRRRWRRGWRRRRLWHGRRWWRPQLHQQQLDRRRRRRGRWDRRKWRNPSEGTAAPAASACSSPPVERCEISALSPEGMAARAASARS